MKKIFLIAAAFIASLMQAWAQQLPDSLTTITGRILNNKGKGIEYVAIGIPGTGTGTISDSTGQFKLELPKGSSDSIMFFHVSYSEKCLPAAELAAAGNPVEVRLEDNVLPEAVVVPGKTRHRRLVNRGMRVPAASASMESTSKGTEVGSLLEVSRKFMLKKIAFEVTENAMPGCLLAVNIYRVSGDSSKTYCPNPYITKFR